jgi:hypothetical protein
MSFGYPPSFLALLPVSIARVCLEWGERWGLVDLPSILARRRRLWQPVYALEWVPGAELFGSAGEASHRTGVGSGVGCVRPSGVLRPLWLVAYYIVSCTVLRVLILMVGSGCGVIPVTPCRGRRRRSMPLGKALGRFQWT